MKRLGVYLLITVALLLLSFGCTALLIKCLCWAFGYEFSWKITFGIWILLIIIRDTFKRCGSDA